MENPVLGHSFQGPLTATAHIPSPNFPPVVGLPIDVTFNMCLAPSPSVTKSAKLARLKIVIVGYGSSMRLAPLKTAIYSPKSLDGFWYIAGIHLIPYLRYYIAGDWGVQLFSVTRIPYMSGIKDGKNFS
jgi:hypothetical protein